MKVLLFTSNSRRHKHLANTLAGAVEALTVVVESKPVPAREEGNAGVSVLAQHFIERDEAERSAFPTDTQFNAPTIPLVYGEVSSSGIEHMIDINTYDAVVVFGSSLLRGRLFDALPLERTINVHLGLSPYYRGAGTNFWPLLNGEPGYIGASILYLDSGIDAGDIITHVPVRVLHGDTIHTIGCRVIQDSARVITHILRDMSRGGTLPRAQQWIPDHPKIYKKRDITDEQISQYRLLLASGIVDQYIAHPSLPPRLIQTYDPEHGRSVSA